VRSGAAGAACATGAAMAGVGLADAEAIDDGTLGSSASRSTSVGVASSDLSISGSGVRSMIRRDFRASKLWEISRDNSLGQS